MSRRAFVVAILALAVASLWPVRRLRSRLLAAHHVVGAPGAADVGDEALETIAALAGALLGHHLSRDERGAMRGVLRRIVALDSGFASEFTLAADYLNACARRDQGVVFADSSGAYQNRLVDLIMRTRVTSRQSQLRALVRADERGRRRIRGQLVPVLARAYASSSVLWARRGYDRQPGSARNPREYTMAGNGRTC